MPRTLRQANDASPDVVYLKRSEALQIADELDMLRQGHIDEADVTDGAQTLRIRKDNLHSVAKIHTITITDTTMANDVTVYLSRRAIASFTHALREWGWSVAQYTFDLNENRVIVNPTIRFFLAAGS